MFKYFNNILPCIYFMKTMRQSKIKQLRNIDMLNSSGVVSGGVGMTSITPMPIDVTTNSFYTFLTELYTKYAHLIRDNIKKIHSSTIDKMVLRQRSMVYTIPIDNLPVANNVYVDIPPVFHLFGLLMPYITRIVQVDMYGIFEQLSNLSEIKQLTETETKLIKMCIMNDVKILDLNDMPLTKEQQMNVLVFLNIFYHVITNSLFQISKEHIPKMIEQNLLNHFNNIIDNKFKMSCIYDKLNDNDPYNIRVLRRTMLAFGIRPVKMKLRHVPASYKGMFTSSGRMPSAPIDLSSDCTGDDDIEEFIDSITITHDKITVEEYSEEENGKKCLSISKFLENHSKLITSENKLYWSKFKRAYGVFPVYIGRRDVYKKKEYEQLLVANVECCETKFNTRRVLEKQLFCNDNNAVPMNVGGVEYYPLALMGVFVENSDVTGSIEDVEFLFINPYSMASELAKAGTVPGVYCEGLLKILKKFDDHFFCPTKKSSADYDCNKAGTTHLNSISTILDEAASAKGTDSAPLSGAFSTCCEYSIFKDFKELLTNANVGLLFLSNKSCTSPIVVDCNPTGATTTNITLGNITYSVVSLEAIKCMIQSSVTTIFYVSDVDC